MNDKNYMANTFLTGYRGWAYSVWAWDGKDIDGKALVAHATNFSTRFDAERAANDAIAKAKASAALAA